MKKLLRQHKLIYESKKKDITASLLFNKVFYFLPILFALLIAFIIPDILSPFPAKGQISATPSPLPLLTQNLLIEPNVASQSVQFEIPLITELQNSIDSGASQTAALTHQIDNQDFCITMPIIMYHHIQPMELADKLGHASLTVDAALFEEHMKYLKEHNYTAISLDDLVNALYARRSLPEKPVMITLDDGYDDNYTYAFMTAKKYQMVMNFMIPTGLVDKPGYVMWDHLREMRDNQFAKIYNHTTSHAGLGVITKEQIIQEVTTANKDLDEKLGIKNSYVIYPYGSYNDMAIQTLRELGITAALSTDPGRNECVSNIMKLPRVRAGNAPLSSYGF